MGIEDELTGKPEDDAPESDSVQDKGDASDGPQEREPEPNGAETTEPSHQVPLAALRDERVKRQALQARLDETVGKMGRMEEMFSRLQADAAPKEPAVPTYEEDAGGHLLGSVASLTKRLEKYESKSEQSDQHDQMVGQQQALLNQYDAATAAFSNRQPDFQEAKAFLVKAIDADLEARGYEDPAERRQLMLYEEGQIVGRMLRQGRDPAEQIFNYAKSRGYTAAGQPKADSEEDKLARLKAGQSASTSLAGPGGRAETQVTLERLAELADSDPKEFDKQWEKARRAGLLG